MRLAEPNRTLTRGLSMAALLPVLLASAAALSAARFPAVSLQKEAELGIADSRRAALRATDWLLAAQAGDGGWSYQDPKREESKGGFRRYHSDVALTALSVQALVRRRELEPDNAQVAAAIDAGVAHLIKVQDPVSGLLGPIDSPSFMVAQALATEALALASGGERLTADREAALKLAVQFLSRARNPYAGWRYDAPPVGDNDARLTGYVLIALTAAAEVDVHASPEDFASGVNYLAGLVDPTTQRTHYTGVEFALRLIDRKERFPAERGEVPTAMHMRLFNSAGMANLKPGDQSTAASLLVASAPLWSVEHGTIDYTYWWQGSEALASLDDADMDWSRWRHNLRSALLGRQVTSGNMSGTWPAVDAWSAPGLEVYATATCALALFADCLSE